MPWDGVHLFECPTRVYYGAGAVAGLPERIAEAGLRSIMLVSDRGLLAAGTVERVAEIASAAGVAVHPYTDTAENPTTTNLEEIAALYREHGCDGLVGLGGGSALDAAKAASALIENGGSVWDYRGRDLVPRHGPPVICIPTTCGTGAEVTFVVVITDPEQHFKVVCASRNLAATIAIVDPELVLTAPRAIIASTGADALAHATESYVNLGSDPLLDAINIRAIRMIGQSLRRAVHEREAAAVAQVSLASCMTGIAFNMNANAVVHAASTPVTARHGVPHGVANAIFLAPGLDLLRPACEPQLAEIASALGEDVAGLSTAEAGERGVEAVRVLCSDCDLPPTLRAWGLEPAEMDIPQLVEDALLSRNIATNPRPIGPPELTALYRAVQG
ncbi:MAG: alcohol dehydrogenase [Gaiellales bacterium]|jgi:alcohol dehydrogenase|nr:alcohol dehydrogenase [Gaiellales bacterium]